jgi:hypothetical protein
MKHVPSSIFLPLVSALFLLASCASAPFQSADAGRRFHESATANVVLRFYGWQTIAMVQPEYREEGFIRHMRREELGAAFDRFNLRRDLAVVVWGWLYSQQQTAELVEGWRTFLKSQGFKRVVCLRADGSSRIDGLLIIHDTNVADGVKPATAGS